jgi:hypothetical protein
MGGAAMSTAPPLAITGVVLSTGWAAVHQEAAVSNPKRRWLESRRLPGADAGAWCRQGRYSAAFKLVSEQRRQAPLPAWHDRGDLGDLR